MTAASTPERAERNELTPLHAIVPLRTLSGGKARLGGALDAEEREALILGMARRTLAVLRRWPACQGIHVVSPDPALAAVLADRVGGKPGQRVTFHLQHGEGLNEAIELARDAARAEGAASVLVLPGDLPDLSTDALDRLLLAADAGVAATAGGSLVAIAPSDARGGTNALLLRPPDIIEPAFGADSFEAHLRAAARVDAAVQVVADAALGFDLDTPEDLELLDPDRLRELMSLGQAAAEAEA